MNGLLPWIVATIALAVVVHVLVVRAFPYLVMVLVRKLVKSPDNEMVHMPPTTAESRSVVRPSPDLLYSACKYDVSRRGLRIRARVPDTYWSISFFADNTDNFFVMNDAQTGPGDVTFVLLGRGQSCLEPGEAHVVEAQSNRGVVLLRALVTDPGAMDNLIAIQKQATCETFQCVDPEIHGKIV